MFILEDALYIHPGEGDTARVILSLNFLLMLFMREGNALSMNGSFPPPGRGRIFRMLLTFRRAVTSYLRTVTIVAHSFPLFASLLCSLPLALSSSTILFRYLTSSVSVYLLLICTHNTGTDIGTHDARRLRAPPPPHTHMTWLFRLSPFFLRATSF